MLRLDFVRGREPWVQSLFNIRAIGIMGGAQLFRWLNVGSQTSLSLSTYHDPVNPWPGNEIYHFLDIVLQPDSEPNQRIGHSGDFSDRLAAPLCHGHFEFTDDLHEQQALRAIVQYNSSRARVLTEFLISHEPVPGTVAYAGCGAQHKRGTGDGQQHPRGAGDHLNTLRGLFLKLSHLHRF